MIAGLLIIMSGMLLPQTACHFANSDGLYMREPDFPDHMHIAPHEFVSLAEADRFYPRLP